MLLSKAVIYSIMTMHSCGITAAQTCRTTRSVPDHALIGHVITSLEGKRLDSCVFSCELTQNCFSINYYKALKKCELTGKQLNGIPVNCSQNQVHCILTWWYVTTRRVSIEIRHVQDNVLLSLDP